MLPWNTLWSIILIQQSLRLCTTYVREYRYWPGSPNHDRSMRRTMVLTNCIMHHVIRIELSWSGSRNIPATSKLCLAFQIHLAFNRAFGKPNSYCYDTPRNVWKLQERLVNVVSAGLWELKVVLYAVNRVVIM